MSFSTSSRAAAPADIAGDGTAALHELRTFASTGRVLHIGAHPDDENTLLIAYLSRGRGYDTAYLSITRGDGGQNLLGSDFDEKLGVARTQELLAARRIDGGRQFFTRAIDFGFSKNPDETLSIWNRENVLGDVVRIIRRFRPDVLVTRFPVPPGSGGHGHHTASAILALDAFKIAGDPKAYPEQLKEGLSPWQPKRILWNGFSRGGASPDMKSALKIDLAGNDPVTGESFRALAGRSRAMHKTQAMGDAANRSGSGPAVETFVLLAGDPSETDLMDGVDTTWSRVPGGERVGALAKAAVENFNAKDPGASVSALLEIRAALLGLNADTIVADKRAQLDRVLQRCLGLEVASRAMELTVVPGETIGITAVVRQRAPVSVKWIGVEHDGAKTHIGVDLAPNTIVTRPVSYAVRKSTPVTQPYWLRVPPAVGMYHVEDPAEIGLADNPPDLPLVYTFEIAGQTLTIADRLIHLDRQKAPSDPSTSKLRTVAAGSADRAELPVAVIPRVAVRFAPGAALFRPGATSVITVEVIAGRPNVTGKAHLAVPAGWRTSAAQSFNIAEEMKSARLAFEVTAPTDSAVGTVEAHAETNGEDWTTDAVTLSYPHIPVQLLQAPARKKVVSVMVGTRGHAIGYVPGAGDDVPEALGQLGYRVTMLKPAQLVAETLKRFDAVVVGVRAFNTRDDLQALIPALSAYAENGGTVVCQYNWARNLKVEQPGPYRLKVSDLRVTNESAPVTFLAPEHPVLNSPNKIAPADFDGWVQERGVYFPSEWDERFVPILAMSDPGESPLKGGLLVAPHGKGYFVYTGLAFFRQLPAGVPGAYRLFANLVSLGK